jgi:hypothetical protein
MRMTRKVVQWPAQLAGSMHNMPGEALCKRSAHLARLAASSRGTALACASRKQWHMPCIALSSLIDKQRPQAGAINDDSPLLPAALLYFALLRRASFLRGTSAVPC